MSFTYDLGTSIGQVRIALGDSAEGNGVRPDGSNLSDEEITHFLTLEGQDVDRATARACEALATAWAGYADLTVGPRSERLSQIAARYAERATGLRGAVLTTGYVTLGFAETDG